MKSWFKLHLLLLIGMMVAGADAHSQRRDTTTILSLENKEVTVYTLEDYDYKKIVLTVPGSDTLCISGHYYGLADQIKLLNNNFILFKFQMHAGKNLGKQRTLLVCVSEGRIYLAADFVSLRSYDFELAREKNKDSLDPVMEIGKYEMNFISCKEDKEGFVMTAQEHERIQSKRFPAQTRETRDTLVFRFDKKHKVIYNGFKLLKGSYQVSKKQMDVKEDTYPMIQLQDFIEYWMGDYAHSGREFYFVDGRWYFSVQGIPTDLFETSPPCGRNR